MFSPRNLLAFGAIFFALIAVVFALGDWFYAAFLYPHTEEGSLSDILAEMLMPIWAVSFGIAIGLLAGSVITLPARDDQHPGS